MKSEASIFPDSMCRVQFRERGSAIIKEFIPKNHGIAKEQEAQAMQVFIDTHCRDTLADRSAVDWFCCDHPEVKTN